MEMVEGHIHIFQEPRVMVGMSLRQAAPVMKMNADVSEWDLIGTAKAKAGSGGFSSRCIEEAGEQAGLKPACDRIRNYDSP